VKPVEPVKEQKPIVEESKPKVKVRKEEKDRETPRKRKSTGGEVTTPNNDEVAPAPKKKLKRLERKVVHDEGKLNAEELMETNTFQRFTRLVEHIFDATEDADLNAPADLDNDTDIPQEAMIPKQQLHDLCAEAAKLKVYFYFLADSMFLNFFFFFFGIVISISYLVNGCHVSCSPRETCSVTQSARKEHT
jgi:cohesin loading factor subunit SCC2